MTGQGLRRRSGHFREFDRDTDGDDSLQGNAVNVGALDAVDLKTRSIIASASYSSVSRISARRAVRRSASAMGASTERHSEDALMRPIE
jgi:hypothetical protein